MESISDEDPSARLKVRPDDSFRQQLFGREHRQRLGSREAARSPTLASGTRACSCFKEGERLMAMFLALAA